MAGRHPPSQELAAFFDGEGDRETSEHVASCERCASRVAELRRLRAHLRSAPLPDPLEAPPPPITTTTSRGAGAERTTRANPLGVGPLVLVFVLLLVILLVVLL